MKTDIGISSACLFPLETIRAVEECADAGFGIEEIFINTDSELTGPYFRKLKRTVRERGIKVTSVHPFTSGYENVLFFVGYDKRIRDGAEYYKKYFNAAAELGAKYVVFHGNNMKNRFCGFERYCEIFQYINSKAEPFGVELIHENVSVSVAADPENIRMLRKTCPDMRFVYDAKQACRGGFDPYAVLDAIGDAVVHVHINDYDLKNSECKPPFKGGLDLSRILKKLKALGYNGDMVVEVYRENFGEVSELYASAKELERAVSAINNG